MNVVPLEGVVASMESGARPPGGASEDSGEIPSLGGEHLSGDGGFDFTSVKRIPRAFFNSLRGGRIAARDILVVKDGATTGKTSFVREDFPFAEAAVNEHVFCVRVDQSKASPEYVFHFLRSPLGQKAIALDFRGATVGGISREFAKKVRLRLPPLPEQRRIAEILDRADALRAKRRATLAHLNALTYAIFLETFAKGLDGPAIDVAKHRRGVPSGWSWELLTNAARLATGHTPDREVAAYWNGRIPWISLTDIRELDGTVAKETVQNVTELGIDNSSSVLLPEGTVCFSRTASIGFVTMMGTEMSTSQDFVNWVCGQRLDPTYLMWALLSARRRLRELSSGSTHKTIYVRIVEQFHVLVPPIELQREFARRVSLMDDLKALSRSQSHELDNLFSSLQHRGFHGEF